VKPPSLAKNLAQGSLEQLDDAEIEGVRLEAVAHAKATAQRARFDGVVRLSARDVRGLVVTRDQAAVLAQLFGLVVRD
jgi:hypothetical protein